MEVDSLVFEVAEFDSEVSFLTRCLYVTPEFFRYCTLFIGVRRSLNLITIVVSTFDSLKCHPRGVEEKC